MKKYAVVDIGTNSVRLMIAQVEENRIVSTYKTLRTIRVGEGMTELTQSKMFDPFFSASKGGTGIGLAVCHQIVEQHHGYFEVTSEVGQGTTVTIVLPQMEKNYV